MKCPSCGAAASGKFCASCGKPLRVKKCPSCGAQLSPGSRFCTGCGNALSGGKGVKGRGAVPTAPASGGNSNLAWWITGALLVVVLISLGYPALTGRNGSGEGGLPPSGMGGATGGTSAVDLATMSPEELGPSLFNRVMTASSQGDTASMKLHLPMALVIHEQLNLTDSDGLYHYALLYQVGGDFEAALAKAQEGLAQVPDYLLLLAVAAEASAALGDESGARELYGHFLDVYDTEMALMRPGYEHHQAIFPAYREAAQTFLNPG